ncbi:MAG: UDP-glucose 4-epimerase GalE [Porticoccaceae bacterium]|nr:UDP-glucose 4-epimerase GalE [Porticoccaceae bacterium]
MDVQNILVTGGAGYIGSHVLVALIASGYNPLVIDNFTNSSKKSIQNCQKITGKLIEVVEGDVGDVEILENLFTQKNISAVIHLAALKSVNESCVEPLKYFKNNVANTLTLVEAMKRNGVHNLIFSSSAAVYGNASVIPLTENCHTKPTNPYGASKLMCEEILKSLVTTCDGQGSDPWKIVNLRYFNPVGAHESGTIGENPRGAPANLVPYICEVANGHQERLKVYGDDYNTPDGTGLRDYIHIMDLAKGHVSALNWILKLEKNEKCCEVINLGVGRGISVFEMVKRFEAITGINIPLKVTERRPGDVAESYSSAGKAYSLLGWKTEYSLDQMLGSAWLWRSNYPRGYE